MYEKKAIIEILLYYSEAMLEASICTVHHFNYYNRYSFYSAPENSRKSAPSSVSKKIIERGIVSPIT